MITFDHFAVSGPDLAAASAHVEAALGLSTVPGGEHVHFGTHNRLMGLGRDYLEAIATDPAADTLPYPRWFDLDRFTGAPRLTNWICRTDDLDATLSALSVDAGTPVALSRGELRWRMAVPADGILPFDGAFPALIEWEDSAHPATRLPDSGARLKQFEIGHPEADALAALLAPILDDPRIRFVNAPENMYEFKTDMQSLNEYIQSEKEFVPCNPSIQIPILRHQLRR